MKTSILHKAAFILGFLFTSFSFAQQLNVVKGTVLDQDNTPIAWANILIKGTTTGVSSDADGAFAISTQKDFPWDLVISYTGYESQTLRVNSANEALRVSLQLGTMLDEIIISASRKAEKVQDAPASVSVVSAKEIKNQAVANPISLIENTVGVSIDKQGAGRTNITMRGSTDLFATSVFVMMDYRSLIGSGINTFDANATTLLPIDVDRVEVVRGPGSALYGPGVTSGVVHFITKDPFKYPGGTIEISAGNLNTLKTNFRYAAHNENNTFGYKLTAFTSKSNEWGLNPNNTIDATTIATFQNNITDPINGNVVGQTGGNLNEKGQSYGGSASLYFRPGNSGLNLVTTAGFNYTEGLYWSSQGEGYQATSDFYLQGRLSYKGLFAQAYYNSNTAPDDVAKKGFLYRTGQLSLVDRKQFEGQLQYNFDVDALKTNITFGGDYRVANLDSQTRTFGRFEEVDDYDIYGGYLQTKTNLSDKLDLVMAARYDGFTGIDETAFSPRVALVYKANENHTFRASYNTAFAPNSALDLYADLPISNVGAFDIWLQGNTVAQTFNNPQTTYFIPGLSPGAGIGMDVGTAYGFLTATIAQQIAANPTGPLGGLAPLLPILGNPAFIGAIAGAGQFSNGVPIDLAGNVIGLNGTAKSTLREETTLELGYVGKLSNKLTASVDLYSITKKNFNGIRQISPLVVFPSLGADVSNVLIPTLTGSLMGIGYPAALAAATAAGVAAAYEGTANSIAAPGGALQPLGLVQTDQAPEGGLPHLMYGYRNFGEVTYYGSDMGLNYTLNSNVKAFANYSWVNKNSFTAEDLGEENAADRFDLNFSQHRLRIGASYEPLNGLQAGFSVKHNSEFESTLGLYTGTVAARTLVDTNLGYQFNSGLYLNFSVDNLTGVKYRTFPALPEIGTQFLLTARYTFGGNK